MLLFGAVPGLAGAHRAATSTISRALHEVLEGGEPECEARLAGARKIIAT